MMDRLANSYYKPGANVMFWQTKSAVQPKERNDEWQGLQEMTSRHGVLGRWVKEGKATSALRPGNVAEQNYQHLFRNLID